MIYEGYIKSVSDRYEYRVTIEYNDNTNNTQEIILADNDPIVITYESEDNPFAPIKTYSCTLNIVNRDYLFDLYSSTFDRLVKVYDGRNNILFRGYVTPDIYNQDWEHTSVISIECISPVAMLKYKDYEVRTKQLRSIDIIIGNLKAYTGYGDDNVFYPKNLYVKYADENGEEQKIINTNGDYVVDDLYIDDANFFDDDEEQTPWKWYEVIEEICKYMAWQLIEYNNNLYFIPIDHIFYNPIPSLTYTNWYEANIYPYLGYITKDSYASNSNNISLQQTYRKIKVIANTYPYEEVIPDIFDTSNLVFAYNGSPSMNNLDIPAIRWTSDTKQGEYVFYWLYCKSKNVGTEESPRYIIHPNLYDIYFDNNVPKLRPVDIIGEQDRYIKSFNSDQEYMAAMAGISVLRATNYNVKESTVNSSLSWNNQITLHHAFNNSGMKLSRTTAEEFESKQLMWRDYLLNNINYGDKWLASVDSSKVITVKKGNYLVLSGKGMISNTGFEDPSITEWKGTTDAEKKKFETANAYKVIDVGSEDRNKEYVGFPLFNIGISVGDITIGGRQCVAMYMYKRKHGDNINYKQTSVTYQWIADGETPYVINPYYTNQKVYMEDAADFDTYNYYDSIAQFDQDEYDIKTGTTIHYDYDVYATSVIKIPVGTNTFSFYRWYDITNTCDWRMGLDNAKGFAIPVDHNLSGVAKVKFYGMDDSLIDYPDEVTSLSCFQSDGADVIVNPNPGWKQGYIWDTFEIKQYYKGSFPNYILLANLSLTINEQTYFSFTDLAFKNENNKGTDHEYSNIIDNNAITDYDDIELKINTQDEAKYRSFSSMMTQISGTNYYITKMAKQDELEYKIQEENIIDIYKDYYSTPRVLFDCDLKDRVTGSFYPTKSGNDYTFDTISPFTYMYHQRTQKIYGVNGFTRKLFDESAECKLYEANVAPWFFTYDGITPIRRAQASQSMPFNEPDLLNPYNLTGTYYSSATGIADVNPETGEVTIHGGGTVEIGISGTAGSTSYELDINRLDPQISWSTGSYSTTLISGSPTGQPYLVNQHNVSPITYWSTDESKAVVDDEGDIAVVGVGGCSIFASFSGSAEYYPASVKYDLTITTEQQIDYESEYFTIEPLENGSISFSNSGLQWSTDKVNWYELYTSTLGLNEGQKMYLKGTMTPSSSYPSGIGTFSSTSRFNVSGNIMSLLFGDNFIGQTSLSGKDYAFHELFSNNNIINADNLVLPATTLANSCYYGMFYGCTLLTSAPQLPATTLTYYCYSEMFQGCTSLTTSPVLPATTLSVQCYLQMFEGCTSLTTAPELPATTLDYFCYGAMFDSCISLTTAPELPATTLQQGCYISMFHGCTSLTTAPELPATTLAYVCYAGMFEGCTSLTTAPELPATTLDERCYRNMFSGCTSLTTAPELPATTLVEQCYYGMFSSCTSLNYIKCLATDISAQDCTYSWVSNVAPTGTFVKDNNMNDWIIDSIHGIPIGWTIVNADQSPYYYTYFAIEPLENGSISFSKSGLQFTTDFTNWYNLGTTPLSVTQGQFVYFKGNMTPHGSYGIGTFSSTSRFNVIGNTMSLLHGDNFVGRSSLQGYESAFNHLFSNAIYLVNANNLILPATTLVNGCYNVMFWGCTSLTSAPELPATTLANTCYDMMFSDCTSLTSAPLLPATTLADYCYDGMFANCTSLTSAPLLPATTLASYCYTSMFSGCTLLTSAPLLPATTLAEQCYYGMFQGCTSLTTAPELPATTLADYCYQAMFWGCTSLTSAPELPATTLTEGCYRVMFYGCTSLTSAPEIPATTLVNNCYENMFYGCTSLNYIKCIATNISAIDCTYKWVGEVASSGTFIKNPNMSSWTTGVNGIPSGWTVVDA